MDIKITKKLIAAAGSVLFAVSAAVPCFRLTDGGNVSASPLMFSDNGDVELSVDPVGKKEGYATVLYDNTNGLPTSEANAIAQTPDGFIWIGSYSGLMRYDGNTFERFDSTWGIASVVSLFVDSSDRLWIGTNDSGAALLDRKGNITYFTKKEGLPSLSVRAITEDSNGIIYLATTSGVVWIDKDLHITAINDLHLRDEYIVDMRISNDDVIYGLTMKGAAFTMENGVVTSFYTKEELSDLGIPEIHAIIPDPDNRGYVYIGTKRSEICYTNMKDGFTDTGYTDISPLEYVNSIDLIGPHIWVCADNGIGVIDGEEFIELDNIPLTSSAEQMITDYQGNLWFVSSKQGVMKIVPDQFSDISELYDLNRDVINSTCMYKDILYIGGKETGLAAIDKDGVVKTIPLTSAKTASGEDLGSSDLLELLEGSRIRSILKDSKDRMWISTFGDTGLMRFDGSSVVKFGPDEGLPSSKRVRAVYERADGSFMVACTGGLAIIEDDKVTRIYDEEDGITNSEILTVSEADNGDMIVGTDGGGIYIISGNTVKEFNTDNGLASDIVMRIKKDSKRNIFWLVMSNSLGYMDSDYNIYTIKNFPYSNNFDLYEDNSGNMWILSSNGIYVASADSLIANKIIPTVFYGIDNGLSCIATSNSYSELTDEGDLYIAGTTGVSKVNINKPFEDVNDIKISVPYVEADGVACYPDENMNIVIPSNTGKVTINCFIFTYTLMNPQVTYYLDGLDKNTTTVDRKDLTSIDYTNLRGGKYTFNVEITDAQGRGSKHFSITIIKEYAFYERAWFYVVVIGVFLLLIAAVVGLFIRRKMKIYEKKEKENKKLVREIVRAFAKTIDMKDRYTNGHSARVGRYTAMLTRELGYDEDTIEKYHNIALMHDIGKIGIPIEVLNKPGKLNDEEFEIIKSHAQKGYDALSGISIMPELAIGAGYHHERIDGKGYPKKLSGDEIPRVAQIIAVADTFDAMYSDRPYRKRMDFDKVVSIIKEVSGTQLASDVVDAFLRLVEKGEFRRFEDNDEV